jgi:hypothetical protein
MAVHRWSQELNEWDDPLFSGWPVLGCYERSEQIKQTVPGFDVHQKGFKLTFAKPDEEYRALQDYFTSRPSEEEDAT